MSLPGKILFCGLGGAGQRHLRLFHELLPASTRFFAYRRTSSTPLLNSDFTVDTTDSLENRYGVELINSLGEGLSQFPDLVVISNPTSLHEQTALTAAKSGCDIFMEKPWGISTEKFNEFRNEVRSRGLKFHISFQLRYHPLIQKAKLLLDSGKLGRALTGSFEIFSDFRQWHPYENWRQLYAAKKSMGGGVLLTEIHETDLAFWFFGKPKKVYCQGGTWSGENIDVEDFAQLMLGFKQGSVMINSSFLHKSTSRGFHIACEKGDLKWEQGKRELEVRTDAGLESFTDEKPDITAMFKQQARDFFYDWDTDKTISSLDSAFYTLAVAEGARQSIVSGMPVGLPHMAE